MKEHAFVINRFYPDNLAMYTLMIENINKLDLIQFTVASYCLIIKTYSYIANKSNLFTVVMWCNI